jgi:hypothetical protein
VIHEDRRHRRQRADRKQAGRRAAPARARGNSRITLIEAGKIPHTIVRSTQFFDFLGGIADGGISGAVVRLSPASAQPIASDDVADALAGLARYFGAVLNDRTLVPGDNPRIGPTHFEGWLGLQPSGRQPNAAYSRLGRYVP